EDPGAPDAGGGAAGDADAAAPASQSAALADIRRRNLRLPLPPLNRGLGAVNRQPVELAKLPVAAPADCRLALAGSEVVFGPDRPVRLQPADRNDGTRQWNVEQVTANSLTRAPVFGAFRLKDQALVFEWASGAAPALSADALRYCLLEVQADGERELCSLNEPAAAAAAAVDLKKSNSRTDLDLPLADSLLPQLRFDLVPQGFPQHTLDQSAGLGLGESVLVRFTPSPESGLAADEDYVELEVQFQADKGRLALAVQPFVHRKEIDPVSGAILPARRPFTTGEVARSFAEHKQSRTALQNKLNQVRQQKSQAEADLRRHESAASSRTVPTSATAAAQAELLQQILQKRVLDAETAAEALQAGVAQTVANDVLMTEARKLYQQLEQSSSIGYRVSIEVAGRRVDILDATTTREAAQATPAKPLTLD
ncbi:MAG TPA: hypothetical protein VML55_25270, partial [Planctomycetaceae bacterium]|nr:hypothetical protein [Planctomycetaceae bacterium]